VARHEFTVFLSSVFPLCPGWDSSDARTLARSPHSTSSRLPRLVCSASG